MEQQNGLRPFDLEAAIRGEQIVTRSGKSAKFLLFNFSDRKCEVPLKVRVDGKVLWYCANGRFLEEDEHSCDLFMAPIEKPKDDIPQGYRPFDLEAAKRGEPILWGDDKVPARWVGLTDVNKLTQANNIIEHRRGLAYAHDIQLFMAPKPKRKLWVNVYGWRDGRHCANLYGNEARAKKDATTLAFGQMALAVAIPIEVEDWESDK